VQVQNDVTSLEAVVKIIH